MSMNEDNSVDPITDDLDAFSSTFFGQSVEPAKEPTSSSEADEDPVEDSDATTEQDDTQSEADTLENEDEDTEGTEEGDEDDEDVDPEPKPEPKKTRSQKRIEQLNTKVHETERKLNEALAKLAQNDPKPEPKPTAVEQDNSPTPDDKNTDGTDKYPLGEYDPNYIKDLTRHTLEAERNAFKARDAEEAQQKEMDAARATLQTSWMEKIGPAQERYPDFQDKAEDLLADFEGIEPAYGDYLEATLMSMEFGPDVLYYLAKHPDEARKIVDSGPTKATIALGRLESKFADADEQKQKARPKVSQAPTPPVHLNKGSAVSKTIVDDDTDDLNAFADKFFKKRGK